MHATEKEGAIPLFDLINQSDSSKTEYLRRAGSAKPIVVVRILFTVYNRQIFGYFYAGEKRS